MAIINSDRRPSAIALIKSLPPSVAEKPYFLHAATTIHLNRGDLKSAESVLDLYLETCPKDLSVRLNWINVRLRRGGDKDVRVYLSGNVEALEGQPSNYIELARLLRHFGYAQRALRLGYRTILRHWDDPQVHLGYVSLFFQDEEVEGINLDPDEIGPDTAFEVENQLGEKETYLIEPDVELRTSHKAVSVDHLVAQRAGGLQVGESYQIGESKTQPESWRVLSIKHKWIDALHRTMESYERRFPTAGGLERVVIEGEGEEAFKPVFDDVRGRHDAIKGLFDQYVEGLLPIALVAHSLGSNTIETWGGLIDLGYKLKVCFGTGDERRTAFEVIEKNANKGCVVDALTCYIIYKLSILDQIVQTCGPVGITQSSSDVFRARLADLEARSGKPIMTLFYKNGEFFRDEVTTEQVRVHVRALEEEVKWVDQNFEILAAEGTKDPSLEFRRITRRVGRGLFDEMLAADGTGRLILSEDRAFRLLATHEFGLSTSWLQPVLMIACDQGIMTRKAYNEAVISMVETGHDYISIDAQVLHAAAMKSEEEIANSQFRAVAKVLGGKNADLMSQGVVAGIFLKNVWSSPLPPVKAVGQTGILLECLIRHHPDEWQEFILAIRKAVGAPNFDQYLAQWLKWHFLI